MNLNKVIGCAGIGAILAGVATASAQDTWADKISMKGDLRLRHETIDVDGKDTRNRARMRARLSLAGEVNDFTDVHVRLASGDDDPKSTNQTFGDAFTTKDIRLDRFYMDLHNEDGLTFWGGKTPMPFETVNDLIYDSDLNPEGVALMYEAGPLFCNTAVWWVKERSSDSDTMMYGGQVGATMDASETVSVMGGLGYFYWDNMAGFTPLYEDNGFGNTLVNIGTEDEPEEVYVNDYGVFEALVSVGIKAALPITLYGDYVVNTEAETDGDTGYLVGAKLGKAKDIGSFEFDYTYRDLEADAAVPYGDSDSFGGGTNGNGHRISGKYQVAKNLQAAATLFVQAIDPDDKNIDFNRLQLDLIAKF